MHGEVNSLLDGRENVIVFTYEVNFLKDVLKAREQQRI
jgi:hypothetical protein